MSTPAQSGDARLVIGLMTGTSLDGLDCALVRIDGRGLAMRAQHLRGHSLPLGDLQRPLRDLAEQRPMTAQQIAELSASFGRLHARAARELLAAGEPARAHLACAHGQTVFHQPPHSWQLFNPAPLARALGADVVFDLRSADLAAGGQGAPITPLADWVLFRAPAHAPEHRVVVNLGGFINFTFLPAGGSPSDIRGGDACVCNNLLDAIARRVMGVPYDDQGRAAAGAEPDADALDDLLGVLTAQRGAGRSLGTGDEVGPWIARHWRAGAGCSGAQLAASACEAIAITLAGAVRGALARHDGDGVPVRLVLAGGGVHNRALLRAISSACSAKVSISDELGVPAPYREAVAFAVLGALCQDRVPITLPAVTGAPAGVLSGCWCYAD
jgi:anhydro-N-acetylmuramic acid kinase